MCKFFSMCSDGNGNPIYFDWNLRKQIIDGKIKNVESPDSHTSIATYFGYNGEKEDKLNKYEYNPITKVFNVDQINTTDDKCLIEKWVRELDFKTIIPQLVIKPISNPLGIKAKKITKKELILLKEWAFVRDSAWDSVRASVGDSVGYYVGASVWYYVRASVWDSVRYSVRASVGDSVWAYASSFFLIDKWKYIEHKSGENPFQCCADLYKRGFVPSFDGALWRLHAGKNAKIVWEGNIDKLDKEIKNAKLPRIKKALQALPSGKSQR